MTAPHHIALLTGDAGRAIHARLIHDRDRNRAIKLYGPIRELMPDIAAGQAEGFGAFIVPNEGGNTDSEITTVRAVFIDGDNVSLPDKWHVHPDFIVQRDATHWHAYWLVTDLPVENFRAVQKRLAAHYGTDPAVCNPSRVMRLAGTLHLKNGLPGVPVTLTDFTDGAERWELGHAAAEIVVGLPEIAATAQVSAASGAPVDPAFLRQAAGYLEPNAPYPIWRDYVAGIGAANCQEARQIAHEFSEGKLDRLGRYSEAPPSGYLKENGGPDAVDRVLDTMPPKDGGVGVGTIAAAARDAGWPGTLAPREDLSETYKGYLATLPHEPEAQNDGAQHDHAGKDVLPSYMGGEISKIIPPRWLVKGLLPIPAVGIIFGKFGTFKTTTKLDLGDSLLTGTKAFGHFDTEQGDVVEVAGEGLSGLKNRIEARASSHGLTLDQYPLLLVTKVPKADRPEEWVALAETIRARGLKPKFIGIDHLSIMLSGQDQNDAAVATQAMQMAHELSGLFQCTVVILAHAGKEGEREVRGSSAFLDNVDFAYELTRTDGGEIVRVRCAKMRDGEAPEPFYLKAQSRHGAAIMTYADKDDARRAAGQQVGLRTPEVSAALAVLGACPSGANEWTGKVGGVPTRPLAAEIARLRHEATCDGLEASPQEIASLVTILNRDGREAGPFAAYVVRQDGRGRQWAIAPGPISGEAHHA